MDLNKPSFRRIVVWGGIAVIGIAALIVALLPSPVTVEEGAVARGPLAVTVDHEGKTRVRERYVVSAPVTGQVLRIELEPGDPVSAGETVLATFVPGDPTPLDARSREEAQARLGAARAALAAAKGQRDQAQAQARFATWELERLEDLARRDVASHEDLERARADAKSRSDAVAAADAAVEQATHELAAARATLLEHGGGDRGSRPTLEIHAPVTGVVLQRFQESRAVVQAGAPLLALADLDGLEIVSDYLSSDAVRVAAGMPVQVERWGGDGTLSARVWRVEPYGFEKTSALGVEEQRVNVISRFDEPRRAWEGLGDGYRVETRIVIWQSDSVLTVPTGALFRHGQSWAVFRVSGGRARLTEVAVGHRNEVDAEITSGLQEGDRVVLYPPDQVADGTRVRPRSS
jgi:HlyD family secretion protein